MNVIIAYILVILVWSTTPLGVKLSVVGGEGFASLVGRTVIGLLLSLACLAFVSARVQFSRGAWKVYCSSALSIVGSMALTYQAAYYVKSGMIAVIYGLSPIVTGIIATFVLRESRLKRFQWFGIALALLGLINVFRSEISLGGESWKGIVYLLLAVLLYALSSVLIKYFDTGLNPLVVNSGSLIVSLPLLMLLAHPGDFSALFANQTTLFATLYLGVVGSFAGFVLYFYVLQSMTAIRAMMIPLITPILALLIGNVVNDEAIAFDTMVGALVVLLGLSIYLMHEKIQSLLEQLPPIK